MSATERKKRAEDLIRVKPGELTMLPDGTRVSLRTVSAETADAEQVYRGILVRPSGNGGWLHREVAIPARLVDEYAEEPARTPDVKPRITDRVMRWLANPDLLRRGW